MNVKPVTLERPGGEARLEPMRLEHAPGLLVAAADALIWKWLPREAPATIEEMREWIGTALEGAGRGSELPFVIVHRPTGQVAGSTRYLDIQPANRALEIGWTWVGAAWRRTAVNTECKLMLMTHAFEEQGAVRVALKTDARNERSRRAIERLGAMCEGRLRKSRIVKDGFIRDTMCYSVIAEEWPDVRRRLEARLGAGR